MSLLKLVLSQRIFLAVCPVEDNCIIIETGLISAYFLLVCLVDDICIIIETGLISAYFSYQCVQWRITVSSLRLVLFQRIFLISVSSRG